MGNRDSDLADVLSSIARGIVESTRHTRASIALWDDDSGALTVAASRGIMPVPVGTEVATGEASTVLQAAIDTHEALLAEYDTAGQHLRALSAELPSRASLISPIVQDDRVVGIVFADDPDEPRAFDSRDSEIIGEMISRAAAAIRLSRLLKREREAARLGEALAEVDRIVHSSLDFDEITALALAEGARAIGAETGAVIGLEPDGWLTWQSFNFEPSVVGVRLTNEENPHGVIAVAMGRPVAIDDAFNDPRVNTAFMKSYELRSVVVAPIVVRGGAVAGLYYNYNTAIHRFTQPEIDFVAHLASSLSVALENSHRFHQERERLLRAETLNGLLELAASDMSVSDVARRTVDYVTGQLDAEIVTLWNVDDQSGRLFPVAASGLPGEFLEVFKDGVRIDDPCAVATAYRENRLMAFGIGHTEDVPEMVRESYARFGVPVGALLALPVRGHSTTTGGITFAWRGPRSFEDDELAFYVSVVRIIAIATEKASLSEAERVQLLRSELIRRIAEMGSRSRSLEDIGCGTMEHLSQLPDFAAGAIDVLDDSGHTPAFKNLATLGCPRDKLGLIGELPVAKDGSTGRLALFGVDVITHEDDEACDATEARLASLGLRSARWIVLPIRSESRVIGTLGLVFRGKRTFKEGEVSLFAGVAATIGPPIANAQLFGELADASERLATILDTIGDAFVALDGSWRYILVNKRAEAMLGRCADDLIGKRMDEEYPDEAGWPFYRRVMDERVSVNFESYAETANAWVEVHAYPTLDGVSMIVSDITPRKIAEQTLEQTRERADMLAMLLDDSSQPFMVGAPGGEFMLFNRAFEELSGYTAGELAALTWPDDLTTPETLQSEKSAIAGFDLAGEPQRFEKECVRKDRTRVPVEVLRHAHRGPDGEIDYYYAFMTDIAQRRAAEEREAESRRLDEALNGIGAAVTTTLDSEEVLRRLVQLSAEAIGAETAGITLCERGVWVMKETFGMSNDPRRSALVDKRLEAVLLDAPVGVPIVIDDVDDDPRVDADAMGRLGIKSLMAVPIVAQMSVVGTLIFHHRASRTSFTAEQVEFATRLMSVATLALDNARLYERERRIADTLQDAVLTAPETAPGIECAVVHLPASSSASIGGDLYDVFRLDDERVAVVVGDVSGKGIEAARLTSLLHAGVRACAYDDCDPTAVVRRVNRIVLGASAPEVFATLFYGTLEPRTGRLEYCVAGHPKPVVVGASGARALGGEQSPLVGALAEVEYLTCQTTLAVGEMLVLFTDGITEARCGKEMFGERRLIETLAKLRHTATERMPDRLVGAVLKFSQGALHDDTVVLCVKRTGEVADAVPLEMGIGSA